MCILHSSGAVPVFEGVNMETSVVHRKLTDGSIVYAVVFVDGSQAARIECVDKAAAVELQTAFTRHASYAEISHQAGRVPNSERTES